MKLSYKYKSHLIALLGSVLLSGSVIVLLLIKPGGNLFSLDQKMESDKDLAIQLQLIEDLETIRPTKNVTNEEIKTSKQISTPINTENPDDSSQPSENDVQTAKLDSVMKVEMQKVLQKEIKTDLPVDSILMAEIQINEPNMPINPNKTARDYDEAVRRINENRKFYYDNFRTVNNLKVIYPYIVHLKSVVDELNAQLATMTDKNEKQMLIKKTEKELFAQFEKDLRKMSYSQGKLMVKIISREMNETAYGLIKNFKGGFTATFWYGVGLLFQENLKAKYDSIGEDASLEKVVKKFKKGDLD